MENHGFDNTHLDLNTISKDIVNAYLYAASARSLWLELESRYGECNGPLLYKIQCEINSMSQDSILVATHLINKLPSANLNWKTPFELLYRYPPSYTYLKTFGCLCYATNTTPHKSKFDQRAFKCIFISYVSGQKGYKFYDIDNKVTLVSRDVIFHEDTFRYTLISTHTDNPIPNPILSHVVPDIPAPVMSSTSSSSPSTYTDLEASSPPTVPDHSVPASPPRRSQRHIKPPAWLNDFQCDLSSNSFAGTITVIPTHTVFLAALSTMQEPQSYLQAKCKKAIRCKWVYKVKLKPNGSVERYKALLIAKGYNQVEGVDYFDKFSPVAKAVTVRVLLAVASSFTWPIHQIDINNAFLHGFLEEDIYTKALDGYVVPPGQVIERVKSLLDAEFTVKDHCPTKYFLGLEIARSLEGNSVTQHKYVRDIIHDMHLQDSKPAATPPPLGLKLSSHDPVPLQDPEPYRRLKIKKQTTIARSTAEAEYQSLGTIVCELQWISYFLHDLQIPCSTPIPLHCANQAAKHIVANPVFHERTKHLEIDCHLVREKYKAGFVLPLHIPCKSQLADIFTKLLPASVFQSFLSKLHLVPLPKFSLKGDDEKCTIQDSIPR
ncbi:Retrovirus-related Pol polyprotein from transposon RE1 [Sesamum angolense]|uniref:Retrovirus-related Pol polyprotein from transposon RE1 n=1 Tax=Sesamum angolense TaxID=2727404 RepID=A0AAE2BHT9_9LAMI|nr:Retrovirus-related Pol polyprotein from transposon RE1 [Sesamum angolense]